MRVYAIPPEKTLRLPEIRLTILPMDYNSFPLLKNETQLTRELWALQHRLTPEQGGLGPREHFKNAANLLIPPTSFVQNRWSDDRIRTIMDDNFVVWWGPGASAKTTDAARAALTYWCAAPSRTLVIVCSTTAAMLDKRVWGEIMRLHSSMAQPIGKLRRSDREIAFEDPNCEYNPKCVIKGVAILQGTVEEAMGNVIGQHNDRVMLVIDEGQVTREALVEARINLRKGAQDFRLLMIGNPTSRTDALGRYSEPEGGWKEFYNSIGRRPFTYQSKRHRKEVTVDVPYPEMTHWKTRWGAVHLYHGFDAPTFDSPEQAAKMPFLIQRDQVGDDIDEYGPDHPRVYTYTLGILPPEGVENKLFTNPLFEEAKARERVVWAHHPHRFMAIDPSFAAGGDKFMCMTSLVGMTIDGKMKIEFQPPWAVQARATAEIPFEDDAARLVYERCVELGIPADRVAIDVGGNHAHVAAALDRRFKTGNVLRVDGKATASDIPLHASDPRPAKALCFNLRTEMWVRFRHYLRAGHIAGLADSTIDEFVEVDLDENSDRADRKMKLKSKYELKLAIGHSPDEADTAAMMTWLLSRRVGLMAGRHFVPKLVDFSKEQAERNRNEVSPLSFKLTFGVSQ